MSYKAATRMRTAAPVSRAAHRTFRADLRYTDRTDRQIKSHLPVSARSHRPAAVLV